MPPESGELHVIRRAQFETAVSMVALLDWRAGYITPPPAKGSRPTAGASTLPKRSNFYVHRFAPKFLQV